MKALIWLTVVFCISLAFWTTSWADMEEVMAILTTESYESFGCGVTNAGDLNRDGFDDLVVGANPESGLEHSNIYFCGPSFDTIPDLILSFPYAGFGPESGAGDVNGDGFDDLMIYCSTPEMAYVALYLGGNPMDTVPDYRFHGKTEDKAFGWTMAPAGDLNGDGYDDLLIGAYMASNGGKAYVFFGGNPMDTVSDLVLRTGSDCAFGLGVGGLGDVNGDGYDDIGVGDPWKSSCIGKAYIYFGGRNMDRIPDLVLSGPGAYSDFGYDISGGDLNGDGYSEIVVSAFHLKYSKIYIYRGGPNVDPYDDLFLTGRTDWEGLGLNVTVAGDLDGDGYNDVVSGTDRYIARRVYAYYGGKQMDRDMDLVLPPGGSGVDDYGQSFAGIDIDGVGCQELCVGSPGENRVYIYRIRHKQLVIGVKPDSREVVKGEEVGFQITVTNNTKEDRSLYFSVDLLDPAARLYGDGPVFGPKQKKVPAGKMVTRHLSVAIPGDPNPGQYTCTVKADTTEPGWPYLDYIENDSFEFELVEEMSGHPFLSKIIRRR
jgi:hypothetical protein